MHSLANSALPGRNSYDFYCCSVHVEFIITVINIVVIVEVRYRGDGCTTSLFRKVHGVLLRTGGIANYVAKAKNQL